mmetsp:Transcript_82981/g.231529  ORF Transcript_82981/g.231529 Transcript_82981/m.231529 type:complete len:306 (+) Transcript_82981:362-1279(+)
MQLVGHFLHVGVLFRKLCGAVVALSAELLFDALAVLLQTARLLPQMLVFGTIPSGAGLDNVECILHCADEGLDGRDLSGHELERGRGQSVEALALQTTPLSVLLQLLLAIHFSDNGADGSPADGQPLLPLIVCSLFHKLLYLVQRTVLSEHPTHEAPKVQGRVQVRSERALLPDAVLLPPQVSSRKGKRNKRLLAEHVCELRLQHRRAVVGLVGVAVTGSRLGQQFLIALSGCVARLHQYSVQAERLLELPNWIHGLYRKLAPSDFHHVTSAIPVDAGLKRRALFFCRRLGAVAACCLQILEHVQ